MELAPERYGVGLHGAYGPVQAQAWPVMVSDVSNWLQLALCDIDEFSPERSCLLAVCPRALLLASGFEVAKLVELQPCCSPCVTMVTEIVNKWQTACHFTSNNEIGYFLCKAGLTVSHLRHLYVANGCVSKAQLFLLHCLCLSMLQHLYSPQLSSRQIYS